MGDLFVNAAQMCVTIGRESADGETVEHTLPFALRAKDSRSAEMVCGGGDAVLALDLLVRLVRMDDAEVESRGGFAYWYHRAASADDPATACTVLLTIRPLDVDTADAKAKARLFQALEWVFSQYTIFRVASLSHQGSTKELEDSRKPNSVARGLEMSGLVLRKGLKSGGKATGHLIRDLGKKYTAVMGPRQTAGAPAPPPPVPPPSSAVLNTAIEKADKHQARAEAVHAGARTLTSAALFPVRYLGKQAAKLATPHEEAKSKTTRALLDVMGGLGNGAAHAFKGITEGIAEMGVAIGDAAMEHSKAVHGEEYANAVTSKYVAAASDVGLGTYKIANVASFGLHGYILDAMIEGTALSIALYDYLCGPVILQGFLPVTMLPSTTAKLYFVVLRPWSIALYSSTDISVKPSKIIPASMLDTIPIVRQRATGSAESGAGAGDVPVATEVGTGARGDSLPEAVPVDPASSDFALAGVPMATAAAMLSEMAEVQPSPDAADADAAAAPALATAAAAPAPAAAAVDAATVPAATAAKPAHQSFLRRMKGGHQTHIELCTVDCSTYLLYPPSQADLETWHAELKAAAVRVETIEKRKSGAEELAMRRRLALLPKGRSVTVTVVRVLVSPDDHDDGGADGNAARLLPVPALPPPSAAGSAPSTAPLAGGVQATPVAGPVTPAAGLVCCPQTTATGAPPPSKLSIADRIRNSALRGCFVRLRSHTTDGTTAEEVITDKAPLLARDGGHGQGLTATWAESTTTFGDTLSLRECDRLSLTVRAETVVGQSIELGRCSVPLDSVDFTTAPHAPPRHEERWLAVEKLGTGKTVARLLVRIGGTATADDEEYNS